jgi:outer membrane protein assembly factor BamB
MRFFDMRLTVAVCCLPLAACNPPAATTVGAQAHAAESKSQASDKSAPAAASDGAAATKEAAGPANAAGSKEKVIILGGDYEQWGSTTWKNNVRKGTDIVTDFSVGKVDRKTGKRVPGTTKNIKWAASLGSQTYGNPIITKGKILIGTNNGAGYLKRYPADYDLGVMLCLDETDGKFLWQYSSEKLPTGKAHDWELLGICSTPIVEGDRAWFVDNRCRIICVDVQGFYDNEDDGPVTAEWAKLGEILRSEVAAEDKVQPAVEELKKGKLPAVVREVLAKVDIKLGDGVAVTPDSTSKVPSTVWNFTSENGEKRSFQARIEGPRLNVYRQITPVDKEEADVVWVLDMMKDLAASPHNASSCSGVIAGDILFMCTSNGVDAQHNNIPSPRAPSFLALDKATGKVLWSDNSPGEYILHGQWSSPAYGVLGGVPQVIFAGGDGYVYSFRGEKTADAKPELLWKFDCNPKESFYEIRGLGTRNHIIGTPVIYDGKVHIAVGEDPEHGDGVGHLWCIDPTKRGDVSPELAVMREDPKKPAPRSRLQAVDKSRGEVTVPNPNSAAIWHYDKQDVNGDGMIDDMQETMHRSIGSVVISDDILYIVDFSGIFHCLDAQTGKVHWTHDFLAACWGSPLICDGKVFIGDEDGDFYIFKHDKKKQLVSAKEDDPDDTRLNLGSSVYGTPIVANNILYVFNRNTLFAVTPEGPSPQGATGK